ncbi:hypothetical protein OAU85_00575 [Candidatus Poseidoniaceae archaeon]|nr:hypothetical protein [Candidatus Poseidoniaceae archaeon]
MSQLFEMDNYVIRTKLLRIFGGAFYFEDLEGNVVAYSKQKRFKLKEDIVLYTDESCTVPLVQIKARSVFDIATTYDIISPQDGTNLGSAKRQALMSILKDSWVINDPAGNPYATFVEDSIAILRRFIPFIPAKYHFEVVGQPEILMQQRFNPLIKRTQVSIPPGHPLDRRVIAAVALLSSAIEGRQG